MRDLGQTGVSHDFHNDQSAVEVMDCQILSSTGGPASKH